MNLFQAIKQRQSVRTYNNEEIAKKDLEKIIDSARLAPTARGEEPWEFVVVTEKKKLREIGNFAQNGAFIKNAAAGIVVISRKTKYYLEDGAAATQNILLAATALGIGSCWIAGDKKPYAEKILALLEVPAGYNLVSIISLGYPEDKLKSQVKKRVEEVIHYNKF